MRESSTLLPSAMILVEKQAMIEGVLEDYRRELRHRAEVRSSELRQILECAHRNFSLVDFNVGALRRLCRLRNNNVSARFRCGVGLSLREYLERLRVDAAQRVMECCDIEIYLVAMAVGYQNQETFCRAFRRQAGVAPSRWQQEQSKGQEK